LLTSGLFGKSHTLKFSDYGFVSAEHTSYSELWNKI